MNLQVKRRVTADEVRRKRRLEGRLANRTRSIFAAIRRELVEGFPALDALPALRPHQNALQAELETHYRLVQREFESDVPRQIGGRLPDGAAAVIAAGLAAWIVRRSTFQADVIITTVRKRRDRAVRTAATALAAEAAGAMASTFGNVDFDGDIIEPGAFTASLQRLEARRSTTGRLMPVLFSHSTSAPVGVFTSLTETEDGLFAKGELPLDDTFVSGRIVPQMRAGSIRALSIGFQILERRFEGELRIIEKIELFEASLVVFGANPQALVTGMKNNNNLPREMIIPKITRDDAEVLSPRELEAMLMAGCSMSVQLSKKVASLLAADLRDVGEPQPAPRDVDATDTDELSFWGDMAKGLSSAAKGKSSRDHRDHR